MNKEHSVIFVPGLGEHTTLYKHLTSDWPKYGLNPVIHSIRWRDKNSHFQSKLQRLVSLIDTLYESGNTVSLVGVSAGASAALNAFTERKEQVSRVVSVCGRLRTGREKGFRFYETLFARSPALESSVKQFEENERNLSMEDRRRIMTTRAKFADISAPKETSILDGSYNKEIPMAVHMPTIIVALKIFPKPITVFLKEGINP